MIAPEPPIGAALINGKPGVLLMIGQQYGANTREVTTRVEAALQELRPALDSEKVQLHAELFRPANFIDTATQSVLHALLIGGALVITIVTWIVGMVFGTDED